MSEKQLSDEQVVDISVVDAEPVNEQTVNAATGNEQTVNEQTVHEQTVHEQTVHEQTVHEQTGEEKTMNEKKRRLYRHPNDEVVGGVCAGLADYTGWDPVLIRILWVAATLMTQGGGLLAYIALWILLPVGTSAKGQQEPAAIEFNDRNLGRGAVVLIVIGAAWLLSNIGILPWLWGAVGGLVTTIFWPLLLIGIGYMLLRGTKDPNWNDNLRESLKSDYENAKEKFNTRFSNTPRGEEMKSRFSNFQSQVPLKRSRTDRVFMGVCGGIGEKINIDANLMRLIWIAASIGSGGLVVLAYFVLGLVLPEGEASEVAAASSTSAINIDVVDSTATQAKAEPAEKTFQSNVQEVAVA
ncbi:MAG: PspC domain-containing protein [Chloroflexota bacterium]